MHTYLAQDFVTIQGSGALTITQGHNAWLELGDYQDAVAWLEVKEVTLPSGGLSMHYQTAPIADEALFIDVTSAAGLNTVPFTPTVGVSTLSMLKDLVTIPLAHWFRWQLSSTGTGSWHVTFRLFVAANTQLARRHRRRL